jgi:hypothetical protein
LIFFSKAIDCFIDFGEQFWSVFFDVDFDGAFEVGVGVEHAEGFDLVLF